MWLRSKQIILILFFVLISCKNENTVQSQNTSHSLSQSGLLQNQEAQALPGAKISFQQSNFYTISQPNPYSQCAGDLINYYHPFPSSKSDQLLAVKPAFIKNVSIDLTDTDSDTDSNGQPNYAKSCSLRNNSFNPPLVFRCASFNQIFFDSHQYYSVFDKDCERFGPLASDLFEVNKLMAGGFYIDLDREFIGQNENLLLNLTYISFLTQPLQGDRNVDGPVFRVHLIQTNETLDELQRAFQPRHLNYALEERFPKIINTLSLFSSVSQGIRQEQVLLPVAINSAIDRIRVERYSGSAVFIDATLTRLGAR